MEKEKDRWPVVFVRVPPWLQVKINKAASINGSTISCFCRYALNRYADDVILDNPELIKEDLREVI